jgi:hypothetical protein
MNPVTPVRALAALFAATFLAAGEDLVYAPRASSKLTRTFETEVRVEMSEFAIEVNGESQETGDLPDYSLESHETIVVVDEIGGVEDGRPARLVRAFETIEDRSIERAQDESGETSETTEERTSELAGKKVVFTLEDDEYRVAAGEGQEIDEELLAGLDEDMDLRGFLPPKKVEPGDEWKVDTAAVRALTWPGGHMHYLDEEGDPDAGRHTLNAKLYEALEGEARARYDGVREEDGTQVGVIHLEVEMSAAAELEGDGEEGAPLNTLEFEREAEGELLWDLEQGHFVSLQLEGRGRDRFHSQGTFQMGEDQIEFEQVRGFTAQIRYSFSAERTD